MKTQFDLLIVAINQELRMCEQEIAKLLRSVREYEQKNLDLLSLISQIQIPNGGSLSCFREIYEGKRAYLQMIDDNQEKIASLKLAKKHKEEEMKLKLIQKEKMKFLQQKQMQRILENLKRNEQKQLDEVAGIGFVRRGR